MNLERGKKGFQNVHGMAESTLYRIWYHMKGRCLNPTDKNYADYGGRGITICERWRDSFATFALDMGQPPKGQTLDRRDNDGPYSPDNCRWATRAEQGRNQRTNIVIEFNGERLCAADWAARTGLKRQAILWRLAAGWSVHDTLTRKPSPLKRGVA